MNPDLEFLLSSIYDRSTFHPEHLADFNKSGLTAETTTVHRFRTVMPPSIFDQLLGFRVPAAVTSMYLIPFFDAEGTLTDHIRVKVFPALKTEKGTVKYLQPRLSGVRIYFPLMALEKVMRSNESLWVVEGEKKSLAVAQLGLASVGICGVEGWHAARSMALHPDFDSIPLAGREVRVVPDADVATNPAVTRAVRRLGDALRARGATPLLVRLPQEIPG